MKGRLDALADVGGAAVMSIDETGVFVEWGRGAERLFGWSRAEVLGRHVTFFAPSEMREEAVHMIVRFVRGEAVETFDTVRLRKDGSRVEVSMALAAVRDEDGTFRGLVAIAHDLAARRRAERVAAYLERAFGLLEGVVDAAFDAKDETALAREACRLCVERGGLRMAWFGRLDPRTGAVVPVTSSGHEDGYLAQTNITARAEQRGMGPTGRAVRDGRPAMSSDIAHDPSMAPWREAALARGYRSAACFPIHRKGKVVGTLNVYAGEPDFFTPSTMRSLGTIAKTLSHFPAD